LTKATGSGEVLGGKARGRGVAQKVGKSPTYENLLLI